MGTLESIHGPWLYDDGGVVGTIDGYANTVLHYYVDGDGGDDDDDGLTTSTPFETLYAVELALPGAFDKCIVHIKSRAGAARYAMPRWRRRTVRRSLILWGDWDWDASAVTVLAIGTFANGSTTDLLQLGGSWTIDQYRDCFIRITSGESVGVRRLIQTHDASGAFTPAVGVPVANAGGHVSGSPNGGAPSSGDGYEIFLPNIHINVVAEADRLRGIYPLNIGGTQYRCSSFDMFAGIGNAGANHDPQQSSLTFANIEFDHDAGILGDDHCFPIIRDSRVIFAGCRYSLNAARASGFLFKNCHVSFGQDHAGSTVFETSREPPFNTPAFDNGGSWWWGYGAVIRNPTASGLLRFILSAGSTADGVFNMTGSSNTASSMNVESGCSLMMDGGSLYDSQLFAIGNAAMRSLGNATQKTKVKNTLSTTSALLCTGSPLSGMSSVTCESVAPIISASLSATVYALDCSGYSSGGVTAKTFSGGKIVFLSNPSSFGHASNSDLSVGDGAPVNRSFFAVDGSALVSAAGTIMRSVSTSTVSAKLTGIAQIQSTPGTFVYAGSSGAISLDVGARNDYRQTDALGGITTITLTGGVDGSQGTIMLVQDGTGYALTIAASGRTVKASGTIASSANAIIAIGYEFATVNSVAYLFYFPSTMT